MERRVALIEDLLARIPAARPVIQVTYGPLSPVIRMPDRYVVSHHDSSSATYRRHSSGPIDEQSNHVPHAKG